MSGESKYHRLFEMHRTAMVYQDCLAKKCHVNQAFRSLFGIETEQVHAEDFVQWIHPIDLPAFRIEDDCLMNHKTDGYELKIRCINKNGDVLFTRMSVSAVRNEQGEVVASLRIIEDVTRENQIEEEIRAKNEELVKTNSELDGFVYTISHDIKAPLSSLKGLIELLKDEKNPTTIAQYISLQEACLERLDTFIQEITEYSRDRKCALKVELVKVEQLVQEVIEQHRYMTDHHGRVKLRMESAGGHVITSDRSRIILILNNLISNGIKYADLSKEVPFVAIRIEEGDAQELIIEVEDNGIGISAEHQSHVFDMFYRAHSTIEGTGIGLHIVKEAIQRIGAKIEVKSVPSEGTIFRIRLPHVVKSTNHETE